MKPYCLVLTCDQKYLSPALVLAAQFARLNKPDLDIIICSNDPLESTKYDFLSFRTINVPEFIQALPANERLRQYTYWRIPAIEALTKEYVKILYLDTDLFLNSQEAGALFEIDMRGYAVAAALDVHQIVRPKRRVPEFAALKLPHSSYFNAGVLLIDSIAWQKAGAYCRISEIGSQYGAVFSRHDQSLLNLAFKDDWLELSPVWNWQYSYRNSFVTEWVAPRLIHFSGSQKPWSSTEDAIPKRYCETYISILQALGEELIPTIPNSPKLRSKFSTLVKNLWYYRAHCAHLERFAHDFSTVGHRIGDVAK